MIKENIRLLVFDCDGVLFDSREANRQYYNYILNELGRGPLSEEELEFVHIHSLPECLEYLLRDCPHLLEKAFKIAKETAYDKFFEYLIPEKGVYEFLSWAKDHYYIALCTNRTTSTMPLLQFFKLDKYFHFIRTALEYPKTDPRALSTILDYFMVEPRETIYVGDSVIDENLCRACEVPLVSYKNPKLNAIRVIFSYEELRSLLQQNGHFCQSGRALSWRQRS